MFRFDYAQSVYRVVFPRAPLKQVQEFFADLHPADLENKSRRETAMVDLNRLLRMVEITRYAYIIRHSLLVRCQQDYERHVDIVREFIRD
jgi:hypothetical protein